MIVDRAVYRDGRRAAEPDDLLELYAACQSGDAVAWLGLYEPDQDELEAVAREFHLHELAVEDAVKAHQRPKLERYEDALFIVLRPARYVDETETVVFGEVEIFVGSRFVITVRHGDAPELGECVAVSKPARPTPPRADGDRLRDLDHVVDGYEPVVHGLENDIDEIEDEVFDASPTVSRRIYELTREVIEFQRATAPLEGIVARLMEEPGVDEEERRYLRDVQDHAIRAEEQAGRISGAAAEHPQRPPDAGDEGAQRGLTCPERAGEEDLGLGGDPFRSDLDRDELRHELRPHARAAVEVRLSVGPRLMLLVSVSLYVVFKRRSWI